MGQRLIELTDASVANARDQRIDRMTNNGGQRTLLQIVEFYNRRGDFHEILDAACEFPQPVR